ncbi:MAG: ABC transporter ATP-binding protein [Chloroherpetonaceae bacterium]|nr:ABC transporter ATP-binding protein [Chloroherpetonaceae bacterium]MCS7212161.1 ABC transporter ATP-binding protein [Chloroherpetonaceae bacterium]MDW8019594.1 ABC transporter ATP-binding protein [Chloroherpetonaceae bacterium]
MPVVIETKNLSKKFGEFYANRRISLSVQEGTVHAVVGENGAGKSTLMKVLYGMYQPDEGEIYVRGKRVWLASPNEAIRLGIGMVHQHFMLVPTLTVLENVVLGEEPKQGLRLDFKAARARLQQLSEQFGLSVNPDAQLATLSVGEEQRVEILKLLYRNANLLILDEPTAVLTPIETEQLFSTLRSLIRQGKTVIVITHKLDEVLTFSDVVSVMRHGELVATLPTREVSKPELARLMVGREVLFQPAMPDYAPKPKVLEVAALTYFDRKGIKHLDKLTFAVHAGEIYGIAGVEGNGQSELLRALWGMNEEGAQLSGEIRLSGVSLHGKSPREIAQLGVSHVPEDRWRYGVVKSYTVAENIVFGRHYEPAFTARLSLKWKALQQFCKEMITRFDVRAAEEVVPSMRIENLSGGNQQKVVVARELSRPKLKLLILAQPTRGIDIGAIELIHQKILEARKAGIAILLISAELEELILLADRIGCLYKGTLRYEFSAEETARWRQTPQEFARKIGEYIT